MSERISIEELKSKKYGKLTIIKEVDKTYSRMFKCKCDCGNEKILSIQSLRRNFSKSCGCIQKIIDVKKYILSKTKNNNECIEWTGLKDKNGYGKIKLNGKSLRTHRVIYEINNEKISSNQLVCHKCDNPSCVNINHLFIGTSQDNMNDMVNKNRSLKHDKNPSAKLDKYKVKRIREFLSVGIKCIDLAKEFDVSSATISHIKNNRIWRNL